MLINTVLFYNGLSYCTFIVPVCTVFHTLTHTSPRKTIILPNRPLPSPPPLSPSLRADKLSVEKYKIWVPHARACHTVASFLQ